MTNTQKFAKQELDILAATVPDAIVTPFAKEILALCEAFGKSGQSGGSAPYYNIALRAGNTLGVKHSKGTKEKLSVIAKARFASEEGRKRMSEACKLKVLSEEHKAKIASAGRLRRHTKKELDLMSKKLSFPVVQLTLDGFFVSEFPNAGALAGLGFTPSSVQDVCRGNKDELRYSLKGYRFVYKKNYNY